MSQFCVNDAVHVDIVFETTTEIKCYAEIETTIRAIIQAGESTRFYFNLPARFEVGFVPSGEFPDVVDSVEVDGECFCLEVEGHSFRSEVKAELKLKESVFKASVLTKTVHMNLVSELIASADGEIEAEKEGAE